MRSSMGRTRYLLTLAGILVVGMVAFFLGRRSVSPGPVAPVAVRAEDGHGEEARARETGSEKEHAGEAAGETGVVKFDDESLKLAALRVEPVAYHAIRSRLAVTGTVEPNPGGVVKVTPRVAGKITAVLVNVGDTVRVGQPLATLASTELAQAKAAYRQATTRAAVAWDTLQRQRKLASLGTFGRPTIEAARMQATAARAEIRASRSDVAAAQAGVSEAESQVQALRAALAQAETQVKVAQSRFNRADLLLKEGLVSTKDWEQAQAEYQRSQADVDAARANIAQGQAKVNTAKANLQAAQTKFAAAEERGAIASQSLAREEKVYQGGYLTTREIVDAEAVWRQAKLDQRAAGENIRLLGGAPAGGDLLTIRAPLGGRITERSVTLGETVIPEKPLFTITNLRTVWVQLNVYQKDLSLVRVRQPVTVASDAVPGRTFTGAISYISDVVDETTRTVKVRCVIQNASGVLKPQAFVRGTIAMADRTKALAAPKDAIQQLDGRPVVFTPADKPGEFLAHPVEVGETFGDQVEIRSGLKAGDRIVTKNAFLIKAQAMKGEFGGEGD